LFSFKNRIEIPSNKKRRTDGEEQNTPVSEADMAEVQHKPPHRQPKMGEES